MIALDVGGTSMKGALFDREMKPLGRLRRATPRRHGPVAVIAEIVAAVHALNEQAAGYGASVRRVGVVVPGIVDEVDERAIYSANIGWENLALGSMLQEATGLPVSLGHDVRAGGAAELRLGAARNARDVLFMPIGTGISAALFCDGRPVRGLGHAGELGHMSVEPGGELCACSARGCLETLASAVAITAAYGARSGRGVDGAAAVAALLTHGDPDAQAVWDRAVDALATALAAVTTCPAALLRPRTHRARQWPGPGGRSASGSSSRPPHGAAHLPAASRTGPERTGRRGRVPGRGADGLAGGGRHNKQETTHAIDTY
ncbi:ROK family protein [Streptomyces niveus]|uniref:ROK family protein n=1 Tax=Streptomyces niveus TaxID=193462 RepID=UPI00343AD50F